ncbi:MAG TPA: ATP-dependent 6-phosphofructokinase [Anaerolineaceae bacterium]|nr:ATP-dependent 6-phosphofructokinase [Anaerolineaceae bacterium]HPN50739.1 ATP-dependent 6-phosphofructokinase [Anaerolineaceae bacterium]
MAKHIGILTAGSDAPGLNAAIRGIGKAAQSYGMQVTGFHDGFVGLVKDQSTPIESSALSGILTSGGTFLGTSREMPNQVVSSGKTKDMTAAAVATYQRHKLDALVCLGGDETQQMAHLLSQHGLNIISLPKAIDNDIAETDTTIGFDTAVGVAAEAIDRLHSTAHSSHRIIIVEIMGHDTGWLALGAGIAGGADVILIPEIPYDVEKIAAAILERNQKGKRFSLIAVSEGAMSKENVNFFANARKMNARLRTGDAKASVEERLEYIESRFTGNTLLLANRLEALTQLDARITILGYLLRGGTPNAHDRMLATQLGTAAIDLVKAGRFGFMVGVHGRDIVPVPLDRVSGQHKTIPLDHPWLASARQVGTSLGD